jgi:hypothetical protein
MCWSIKVIVFCLAVLTATMALAQTTTKEKVGASKTETKRQIKSLTSSPIDSTTIKKTTGDIKEQSTKKIFQSQKAIVKTKDDAIKDIKQTYVSPDTVVKEKYNQQKSELKKQTAEYKSKFQAPKYSDIQIDTGEIPLDKQGLSLRGKGVIKSNTKDYSLPGLPKNTLNSPNGSKLDPDKYVNKAREITIDNLGEESLKKVSSYGADSNNGTVRKVSHFTDSVSGLAGAGLLNEKLQFGNAKTIYSEKFVKKMRDSLGLEKADSLYRLAAPLMKKNISEHDLVGALNSSIAGKTKIGDTHFNPGSDSIPSTEFNKFTGMTDHLNSADLSKIKLPDSIVSELTPLRSRVLDNKYLKAVDSLRKQNLKTDRLQLEEKKLTENIKTAALKKKPNFYDRSYIEGVIGFLQTGKLTLFQASPSYAYHFTPALSLGVGPNILLKIEDKKLSAVVGLRYFSKLEFLNRRLYAQLEDNINPTFIDTERVQLSRHSVLAGGGVVLPFSKKLALNFSAFYKINQTNSTTSPWVIRLGLSALKIK